MATVIPSSQPVRQLRYWSWWLLAFVVFWVVVWWRFPEPLVLAEAHWPLVLVGFCGAVIGNATAIGGGLVFIPVMIFAYRYSPFEALMLAIAAQAFGMTRGAIAPFLAQWVGQRQLKIGFAAVAIADGVLFIVQYLRS